MPVVGDICRRDVIYTERETTVVAATKLMRRYHVGTLVVVTAVDGCRTPVGILTDRDIVMGIDALDLDPKTITVGDIMSRDFVTVQEDKELLRAAQIMRYEGVRELPVIDRQGDLAGIVSIDDLLEALTKQVTLMACMLGRERKREVRMRG